jgi:hypothetical protein
MQPGTLKSLLLALAVDAVELMQGDELKLGSDTSATVQVGLSVMLHSTTSFLHPGITGWLSICDLQLDEQDWSQCTVERLLHMQLEVLVHQVEVRKHSQPRYDQQVHAKYKSLASCGICSLCHAVRPRRFSEHGLPYSKMLHSAHSSLAGAQEVGPELV